MEPMVQVPTSKKIDLEVNLTDIVNSNEENTNESVCTFLVILVDQRTKEKLQSCEALQKKAN